MLISLLGTKKFYGVLLLLIPAYTWTRLFKMWARLKRKVDERKLFYSRHNCVVMCDAERGLTGWPSIPGKLTTTVDPIIYFISTAVKSLDIAMMVISNDLLVDALIKAHKRGILVRIVTDYHHSQREVIEEFRDAGISVHEFKCFEVNNGMMHYKYMLKDYYQSNGFACIGSQNWSNVSFKQHYENTVFTTNQTVVEAVHKNFKDTWNYLGNLHNYNSNIDF